MKTILITGINGFLGSHLAKTLKKEYNIIGLEHTLNNMFRIKDDSFRIYSSKDNFENIFKDNLIFAIIHAATIYRRNNEPMEKLIATNVILPVKLYELANRYGCSIFLNTDSYFNNPKYNYSYLPDYTLSKKQALEWLKLIQSDCKLVNMKIFHMYGPNDASNKFVPEIINKLTNNEPYIDTTYGEQTRDFIFIDDVVSAFKCVIKAFQFITLPYNEFQVGTGNSISVKEFLITAKKILKSNTELRLGTLPYRENEIMHSKADNSALMRLGWFTKYTIKEGVLKTIKKH